MADAENLRCSIVDVSLKKSYSFNRLELEQTSNFQDLGLVLYIAVSSGFFQTICINRLEPSEPF